MDSQTDPALSPQAPEIERTVFGAILIDKKAADIAFDLLDEAAFYEGRNKKVFICMKELFDQDITIDLLMLTDALRKKQWLEQIGEEPYLAEIAQCVATASNIGIYCRQLLEKAALRDLISLGFEAQQEDASSRVLLERIKALANRFDLPGEGYDLSQWDLSRFSGELEPELFLVHNFIPSGIAGTLYGAGGTGKSTLGLDLSVRVSVAGVYPTKWLDKFQVEEGKRVLYISAEEPEKILQRRLKGLNEAIADELGVEADTLWKTALPNFFIVNLWGKPVQLFDIKGASISPTNEYARILATLIKENIGLLVIDTRSRVSPAEGAGNAIVAREVSFYEQWAALSGASVLILHHSNKASYNGAVHAQAAQRGESSFTDCLRFGIYLQAMSEETAASNGIREEERKNYLSVTHAKSNYTRIQDPIVLHRNGWSFELTDFKAKPIREEMKARQAEEDLALMLQAIRENPGINQREAMKHFKGRLSPFRVREALKNAATGNLITTTSGERGALHYFVNELSASP